MKRKIFIILSLIVFIPIMSFAHPGRTDNNGGHYDRSTGEYHYHHGYPAHQHPNGICPYDNETIINNNTSNTTKNNTTKSETKSNLTSPSTYNSSNKKVEKDNSNTFYIVLIVVLSIIAFYLICYLIDELSKTYPQNDTKNTEKDTKENNIVEINPTQIQNQYICPRCGGNLKIKNGRYGKFIGCSNYPNCRYTRNLRRNK